MKTKSLFGTSRVFLIGIGAFVGVTANAVVIFDFNTVYTGVLPGGTAPFATATISDVAADTVRLRLDHNAGSADGQFITQLNLNMVSVPSSISFSNYVNLAKFNLPITYGENFFTDAGTQFDMKVQFQTSGAGGGVNRLKPGEFVSVDMTATGLTANNFLAYSNPVDGMPPVLALLHMQGIGPDGEESGKLEGVPEPATLLALGAGLAALASKRRKK